MTPIDPRLRLVLLSVATYGRGADLECMWCLSIVSVPELHEPACAWRMACELVREMGLAERGREP